MSSLSMVEAKLPPGFRFHPRDDELICDYLMPKAANSEHYGFPLLVDVDLNKIEPWDLPEMACVGDKQWYFFNLRDLKYATGQRTNRATLSGYWKATGKDRAVARDGALVGMRKTLVFYQGRAPKGRKTDWVMHEFRMEGLHPKFSFKEDWVLCRVVCKSIVGMCSKPGNSETSSSFLLPLTDTYINLDGSSFEQVPCFSSFTQIPSQQFIPMTERNRGSSSSSYLNPAVLPCDNNVIKSAIDHICKLEGDQQQKREEVQPSLGHASCQSYLTETAISSSMWYHF